MRLHNVFSGQLSVLVLASLFLVSTVNGVGIAGEDHIPAKLNEKADPNPWAYRLDVAPQETQKTTVAELKAKLTQNDFLAALKALNMALNEVGDGATFVWRRKGHGLKGAIKPTAAFRSQDGRVCRHLVFALSLGGYVKSIESIACRQPSGAWVVDG